MKTMNKFTITYSDGSKFEGIPLNKDWNKIDPSKAIVRLEYIVGKSGIRMEGYLEYNHLIARVGLGQKGIPKIYLVGRTSNASDVIVIDFVENTVSKKITPKYQEFKNTEFEKMILKGWQKGVLNNPKSYFKKL